MIRTIWTCWLQGRETAPPLVQRCLRSWEEKNPGWTVKCLDATTIERYVPLSQHIDLSTQTLTAASLTDVTRILLLHEFGGVWVDATLFCNQPLDEWLPGAMQEGFFVFSSPAPDRLLASWFLAAESGSPLVTKWCREVLSFWSGRSAADDYFWFHRCFRGVCERDSEAAAAWARVRKVSADGPHSLCLHGRVYRPLDEIRDDVDWTSPVFKFTNRLDFEQVQKGSLLEALLAQKQEQAIADHGKSGPRIVFALGRRIRRLLKWAREALARRGVAFHFRNPQESPATTALSRDGSAHQPPRQFASLKVTTENLGDHMQILAGQRLLRAMGIVPEVGIDRDDEIGSAPVLRSFGGPIGILLNGWFKTNGKEWPPHPGLLPLFHGFHIRLFQCPELLSSESLDYFRRHEPIGCRDPHTQRLLHSHGIEVFTTNCLTLTLPRRIEESEGGVFVVSRDERIRSLLPPSIGPYEFISHYSGTRDFAANMSAATALLEQYRTRARLIVTTLLHCALPAIAMGIPVVVIYPLNEGAAHESDRERFSALDDIAPVHSINDLASVDWNPLPVDFSARKLVMLETFYEAAARRWGPCKSMPLGPIAPPSALPPP
jgi:hypothetical protein